MTIEEAKKVVDICSDILRYAPEHGTTLYFLNNEFNDYVWDIGPEELIVVQQRDDDASPGDV